MQKKVVEVSPDVIALAMALRKLKPFEAGPLPGMVTLSMPLLDRALANEERAVRVRDATRACIDRISVDLQAMRDTLGLTPFLDAVIGRMALGLAKALRMKHTNVESDLVRRLVREASTALATARRVGDAAITGETLADGMIERCERAALEIIPFGQRLRRARVELIAAIDASSRVGKPKKKGLVEDERGVGVRSGTAPKTLRGLLKALGLPAVSPSAHRQARRRSKPRNA